MNQRKILGNKLIKTVNVVTVLSMLSLAWIGTSSASQSISYVPKELIGDCETLDPIKVHFGKLDLEIPARYSPNMGFAGKKLIEASTEEFGEITGIYCKGTAEVTPVNMIAWHPWTIGFIREDFDTIIDENLLHIFFVSSDNSKYFASEPPDPAHFESKKQVEGYWFLQDPGASESSRTPWFKLLEIAPPNGKAPIWGECLHIKRSKSFSCSLRLLRAENSFQTIGNYVFKYGSEFPEQGPELSKVFTPNLWRNKLNDLNVLIEKQTSLNRE